MIVTSANGRIESPSDDSDEFAKDISSTASGDENHARGSKQPRTNNQPRRDKARRPRLGRPRQKPIGMTSTHAVAIVKRLFQAKARGPRRHARSARLGRIADRARRSHQDRSVRDGWPQALSLYGRLGRGTRYRRQPRGRVTRTSEIKPSTEAIFRAVARGSRGSSSRPRRNIPRSRSRASGAYDLARDGETVELKAAAGRDSSINLA